MIAHVLLNLLNELGRDKMQGMLDSIYHMTKITFISHFWRKKCYYFVIMYARVVIDVITFPENL